MWPLHRYLQSLVCFCLFFFVFQRQVTLYVFIMHNMTSWNRHIMEWLNQADQQITLSCSYLWWNVSHSFSFFPECNILSITVVTRFVEPIALIYLQLYILWPLVSIFHCPLATSASVNILLYFFEVNCFKFHIWLKWWTICLSVTGLFFLMSSRFTHLVTNDHTW